MATELDTPIVKNDITHEKINRVVFDLDKNMVSIEILGYDVNGNEVESESIMQDIWTDETHTTFNLPASVTDAGRSLYQALTTIAKNQGWIGAGTTVDDI